MGLSFNTRGVACQFNPILWANSNLAFSPDPIQAEVLASTSPRLILCCTRQWGKSTITALKAVHYAWFHPKALVLVAAPTLRQSGEWIRKAAAFLLRLGIPVRRDGLNPYSLVLPNHARLVALPGSADNVRGFSAVSLLLVDEAAFVPDPLYHALTPTLAVSGGALWLMSTPGAQCGFFYDTWHSADPLWRRVSVPAAACPRISQAFLDEQRLALGETAFRREFCCEFLASDLAIFPRELFDAAFDPNLEPANHGRPYFRD